MAPEFFPFVAIAFLAVGALTLLLAAIGLPYFLRLLPRARGLAVGRLRLALLAAFALVALLVGLLGRGIRQQYFLDEPLASAALTGNTAEVRSLLDRGASPNAYGVDFASPALVNAATKNHVEIVKLLLDRGADPNLRDVEGRTAVAVARQQGHMQVAELLEHAGGVR